MIYTALMWTWVFCARPVVICIVEKHISKVTEFLPHLSRKIKWLFLIACRPSVKFSHIFLQNLWANIIQLATKHPLVKRIQSPFQKGSYSRNSENSMTKIKNFLLQNHWANYMYKQTWHKASLLGWRDFKFI